MAIKNIETFLQVTKELKQTGKSVVYNFGTFQIVKVAPKNYNLGKPKYTTKVIFKPSIKIRKELGKLLKVIHS
jgi:hypothetical protein